MWHIGSIVLVCDLGLLSMSSVLASGLITAARESGTRAGICDPPRASRTSTRRSTLLVLGCRGGSQQGRCDQ